MQHSLGEECPRGVVQQHDLVESPIAGDMTACSQVTDIMCAKKCKDAMKDAIKDAMKDVMKDARKDAIKAGTKAAMKAAKKK